MSNAQDNNTDKALVPFDRSKYDGMSAIDLIRAMAAVRARKERGEAVMKLVNEEYDFLRNAKIPAKFEEDGIAILKVEGVGRCNLTGDLQATIPSDRKDDAFQWLRDTGRGDVIQETVNSSTLKAMVKAMMQGGEDVPDCFRVHTFSRASITKA
jgi:hypothetical protein